MVKAVLIIFFIFLAAAAFFYFSQPGILEPESVPWLISRSSGIAAYIMMFLIVVWGLGMTAGPTYKIAEPPKAWAIHKYMSFSLVVLVLTHIISLLFDKFINFKIKDVLVPFFSGFKPEYLSLGIIAFYILLTVILTSILLREKTPKLWRIIHYLTYPLFAMALAHGLFIGTDSKLAIVKTLYWVTGSVFLLLLIWRFGLHHLFKRND